MNFQVVEITLVFALAPILSSVPINIYSAVYCKFVESYFLILQFILFQHTVLRQPQIGRAVQFSVV